MPASSCSGSSAQANSKPPVARLTRCTWSLAKALVPCRRHVPRAKSAREPPAEPAARRGALGSDLGIRAGPEREVLTAAACDRRFAVGVAGKLLVRGAV